MLTYLDEARGTYMEKGDKNMARRAIRGSALDNVIPLLELIPDDNGLRSLRAGLGIIFKAGFQLMMMHLLTFSGHSKAKGEQQEHLRVL